jgi:taurine dioxygenase
MYLETPPMGTMLIAREVPPRGGYTLFANTYLAYETLSEGMKRMLDELIAVNRSARADVTRTREDRVRDSGKAERKEYISEHPVVRTHPETGRKALYINIGHTVRFKDAAVQFAQRYRTLSHRHRSINSTTRYAALAPGWKPIRRHATFRRPYEQ